MRKIIISLTIGIFSICVFAQEPTNPVVKPDNSRTNERDQYLHEYTAQEQGKSKEDINLTRLIRREIMKDKSLSFYAKNIKVITLNGQVTLKGPVRSVEEVKNLVSKAQQIAGTSSVLNQLDIASRKRK